MHATIDGIAVRAVSCAVPENVLEIASLADAFGGRDMERVIASSGIRELRIVRTGQTAADLCESAARRVLEATNTDPTTINGLVFVSQTPDYRLPATSAILQYKLGLSRDVVIFDINHGCVGWVYGLYQAAILIAAGGCERVLVLAGDTISSLVNSRDRATRVLMGDAGSATIVERDTCDAISFEFRTDGSRYDALIVPAGGARLPHCSETAVASEQGDGNWRGLDDLYMNGLKITEFALSDVVQLVKETLQRHSLRAEDVGQFLFHQANRFIVGSMTKSLGLSPEQAPLLVEQFGNTSSTSIPMSLCQKFGRAEREGRNHSLHKTMLIGFGVGLSWGTALLDISDTRILPVEEFA